MEVRKFNLELAKQDHPVQTRSGHPARIICFDRKNVDGNFIITLVNYGVEAEGIVTHNGIGHVYSSGISNDDLVMAPEKIIKYVNVYDKCGQIDLGSSLYDTEEIARKYHAHDCCGLTYLGPSKIEVEV